MKPKEIIKITRQIARPFRVTKGKDFRLKDVDPNGTLDFTKEEHKPAAKEALALGVTWELRFCETCENDPVFSTEQLKMRFLLTRRYRSKQSFPLVKTSSESKLASAVETQPCVHLATLSAFRVGNIPIVAARNKDVRSERIVIGFHLIQSRLRLADRNAKVAKGLMKPSNSHSVHVNILTSRGQLFDRQDQSQDLTARQLRPPELLGQSSCLTNT